MPPKGIQTRKQRKTWFYTFLQSTIQRRTQAIESRRVPRNLGIRPNSNNVNAIRERIGYPTGAVRSSRIATSRKPIRLKPPALKTGGNPSRRRFISARRRAPPGCGPWRTARQSRPLPNVPTLKQLGRHRSRRGRRTRPAVRTEQPPNEAARFAMRFRSSAHESSRTIRGRPRPNSGRTALGQTHRSCTQRTLGRDRFRLSWAEHGSRRKTNNSSPRVNPPSSFPPPSSRATRPPSRPDARHNSARRRRRTSARPKGRPDRCTPA